MYPNALGRRLLDALENPGASGRIGEAAQALIRENFFVEHMVAGFDAVYRGAGPGSPRSIIGRVRGQQSSIVAGTSPWFRIIIDRDRPQHIVRLTVFCTNQRSVPDRPRFDEL